MNADLCEDSNLLADSFLEKLLYCKASSMQRLFFAFVRNYQARTTVLSVPLPCHLLVLSAHLSLCTYGRGETVRRG